MINFILVEDNHYFNEIIINIVNKFMKKFNIDYKFYSFFDYTKQVYEIINDETMSNKIYILDIVCPSNYGTSITSQIRKNDIKSFIIFITAYYNQYQQTMLSQYFMFLAFIDKEKNYEQDLINALDIGISKINDNNIIRISHGSLKITLEKKDIRYIYIEERRTYIVTNYNTFNTSMTLREMFSILGYNFIYCHKSIIVNVEAIKNILPKSREIYFDDKDYIVASKTLIKNVIRQFEDLCIKQLKN